MSPPKIAEKKELKYLYARTVNGTPYLYFRMANGKLESLPVNRNSAEFKQRYAACLAIRDKTSKRAYGEAPRPQLNADLEFIGGTVGHGIVKYKTSNLPGGFKQKSSSTQKCYGYTADVMRRRIGDLELASFDVVKLDRYLAGIATEFGNATAKSHRNMFSLVWKTCRKFPEFHISKTPNPVAEADQHYGKAKHSHRAWTEAELALFNRTASQDLKDAVLLLMFSLQRGGDCIKMKWSDYDGKGITLTPEKDREGGVPRVFWSPCVKPLRNRLDAKRRECGGNSEYILTNMWGERWASSATIGNAIRKHLFDIKLAVPHKKTISMHGLRTTGAKALANLGMSLLDIQAMTNHMSDRMAKLYISDASQKIRAQRVAELWDDDLEKIAADNSAKHAKKQRANFKVVR